MRIFMVKHMLIAQVIYIVPMLSFLEILKIIVNPLNFCEIFKNLNCWSQYGKKLVHLVITILLFKYNAILQLAYYPLE